MVALHIPLADNTDCIFGKQSGDILNLSQRIFYPGACSGPSGKGGGERILKNSKNSQKQKFNIFATYTQYFSSIQQGAYIYNKLISQLKIIINIAASSNYRGSRVLRPLSTHTKK